MSGAEVLVALSIVSKVIGIAYPAIEEWRKLVLNPANEYRRARYGVAGILIHWLYILDMDEVQRYHWDINRWKDEEVLAWKTGYLSTCSAIAVAGAIFASLGLSALQLPNLNQTHWTARALLSCGMALGILSVISATSQQQKVSMLNNPLEIRLWLSRGRPSPERLRQYPWPFSVLPLESSASAVKQFALPKVLLNLAVFLYLLGFGIYLLFSWLDNVETPTSDYRNIFIVFVAALGVHYIYHLVLEVLSFVDQRNGANDYDLDSQGRFAKPVSQQLLELRLDVIQHMRDFDFDFEDADEHAIFLSSMDDALAAVMARRNQRKAREEAEKRAHA
ncbi:hypothetical protein MMC34_000001 [Xylographa carneopallida]|nr:hypothetical protein [Xylographa carneopallida]